MMLLKPATEDELAAMLGESERVAVSGGGRQRARWPEPPAGATRLSLADLPPTIDLNAANLTVRAAASVRLPDLQDRLRAEGFWYPPAAGDTGASTVGGHVAGATAGTRRSDGAVRDWVLGVRALLADGRTVRAGGEMIKNVAGYDLVRLFTGSGGTLGVLAAVAMRVAPVPAFTVTHICDFVTADAAASAAQPFLRWPDGPVAAEVVPSPDGWRLLTRWEGDAEGVAEAISRFRPGAILIGGEADAPWRERDARLFGAPHHAEVAVPLSGVIAAWHTCEQALRGREWYGTLQPLAGVIHIALPAPADLPDGARWRSRPPSLDGPLAAQVRAALDPLRRFLP